MNNRMCINVSAVSSIALKIAYIFLQLLAHDIKIVICWVFDVSASCQPRLEIFCAF
ncbi:uncharacterized protein BDW70DRAFT_138517 [Aspergillus foveolatus]|uniref:uncharacterized protein n=1 Tax=Aspergillus foveolatus TaxID=210207 RepID=UPI003CCCEF11